MKLQGEAVERYVEVTEMYQEKYPTGKRNYEMIDFGPVIEKRTIFIPEDCQDPNALLEQAHQSIHDRLVRVVGEMVNKAIRTGRLVGITERK